jgi:hypothetical protein
MKAFISLCLKAVLFVVIIVAVILVLITLLVGLHIVMLSLPFWLQITIPCAIFLVIIFYIKD